jgi:hypothetical protein
VSSRTASSCHNSQVVCPLFARGPVAVRPRCLTFDDGKRRLLADLRIECGSRRHDDMVTFSVFMTAVVPVGFPLAFLWVLWRHRRSLYPRNRDRCVRVRHSPDAATPCIVACVKPQFSAIAQDAFDCQLQQLGRALQGAQVASPKPHPRRFAGPVVAVGSTACALASGGAVGGGPGVWGAMPGPGDPSLQRAGEAMYHYALPPTHRPDEAAELDALVEAWHVAPDRYSVRADLDSRRADPSVRDFTFLYEVCGPKSCAVGPPWHMCCGVPCA